MQSSRNWPKTQKIYDALSVLGSEFLRRGLQFERQNLAAITDQDDVKLVAVRRFRDLPEALVAKGLLDSANIGCFCPTKTP